MGRSHLLGQTKEILNDSLFEQYKKCLLRCSFRSTSILNVPYNDILSLLYYLLIQDRIEESLAIYSIIDSNQSLKQEIAKKVPLCFDYLRAYMALFVDESNAKNIDFALNIAAEIAAKYRLNSLISSKQKLFEDIEILVTDLTDYRREDDDDAIIHGIGDRDRTVKALANKTPSLNFKINQSERSIVILSANIKQIKINFYTMRTEILFSHSPFVSNSSNSNKSAFAYIAPNESHKIEIAQNEQNEFEETVFAIPQNLKNQNLFVEIVSDTLNKSEPFYDHELNVLIQENYGRLKVSVPSKKKKNKMVPLQKAYIKVYSQTNGGANEFYKDGYSDIRGAFDYASISTDQLSKTKKFAIFVQHQNYGSTIKEAMPPKQ